MAFGGGIERARLEVNLEAQDRAQGALQSFSRGLARLVEHARRAAHELHDVMKMSPKEVYGAGTAFEKIAYSAKTMGASVAGSFSTIGRGFSSILSVGGQLFGIFTGLLRTITGVIEKVYDLAKSVVEWIGHWAMQAVHFFVGALEKLGRTLLWIAGIATAVGAALTVAFVRAGGEMERYQAQFKVLLGSVSAAKDMLKELTQFAAVTPFTLPEVIQGALSVKAYRLDQQMGGMIPALRLIGDTAAGTGSQLSEVINTLGKLNAGMFETEQVVANLKLTKKDFEDVGIAFSKTGEAMNRQDLFPAAIALMQRYSGLMGEMALTSEGKLSNLSDAWFRFKAKVGAAILPLAKTIIDTLGGALDKLAPITTSLFTHLAQAFGPVLQSIIEGGVNVLLKFLQVLDAIAASDRFQQFTASAAGALEWLGEVIGGWLDWLGGNWESVWDGIASFAGEALLWIADKIGVVVAAINYLVETRASIWDWAQELARALVAVGQTFANAILQPLKAILESIQSKAPWVLGIIGAIRGAITGISAGATVGAAFGGVGAIPGAIVGGIGGAGIGFGIGYGGTKAAVGIGTEAIKAGESALKEAGRTAGDIFREHMQQAMAEAPAWYNGLKGAMAQGGQEWRAGAQNTLDDWAARGERFRQAAQPTEAEMRGWQQAPEGGWILPYTEEQKAATTEQLGAAQNLSSSAGDLSMAAGDLSAAAQKFSLENYAPNVGFQEAAARLAKGRGDVGGQQAALAQAWLAAEEAKNRLWPLVEENPTVETMNLLATFLEKQNDYEKQIQDLLNANMPNPMEGWGAEVTRTVSGLGRPGKNAAPLQALQYIESMRGLNAVELSPAAALTPFSPTYQMPYYPEYGPVIGSQNAFGLPTRTASPAPFVFNFNIGQVNDKAEMKRIAHSEVDKAIDELYYAEASATGNQS